MKRIVEAYKTLLSLIPDGIELWTNPPRAKGSKLRYKGTKHWHNIPHTPKVHGHPELRIVELEWWDPSYGGRWVDARIAIDVVKERIDFGFYTTDWLFDCDHKGSGAIGVFLFSLPVTLPLMPVLLSIQAYRSNQEKQMGMSRHAIAILDAIKPAVEQTPDAGPQIPDEIMALLMRAFKNT